MPVRLVGENTGMSTCPCHPHGRTRGDSTPMTAVPTLPDTAPFSPAQRAWLNGFFAGLFTPRTTAAQPIAPQAPLPAPAVEADEEMPWHDPALPLAERMKLAEGRPRERVLM